jgi:hypothetical protein
MANTVEHLYAVVDYGSSSLKFVYSQELNDNPQYFMMKPEVIEIPATSIEECRQKFNTHPVGHAVVGIEGRYYAVGELARTRFHSTMDFQEPKTNNAIRRTLAAVAVAVRLCRIKASKIRLFLCCVLPPGELRDSNILEDDLRQALKSFKTPMGELQILLKYFNCHPEGGGLSLFYEHKRGDLGDRSLGVIMMGHRNSSCFKIVDDTYSSFRSSDLGFIKMVDYIRSRTSGYKDSDITVAVATYLLGKEQDKAPLLKLLLRNTDTGREKELDRLIEAIASAKIEFWQSLSQWLRVQLPKIDEIVFGGGASQIFLEEIVNYFKNKLPNVPGENYQAIYLNGGLIYPEGTSIPPELQARFADVQCLWEKDILPVAKTYWNDKK